MTLKKKKKTKNPTDRLERVFTCVTKNPFNDM